MSKRVGGGPGSPARGGIEPVSPRDFAVGLLVWAAAMLAAVASGY
jgi:hypothetical protein